MNTVVSTLKMSKNAMYSKNKKIFPELIALGTSNFHNLKSPNPVTLKKDDPPEIPTLVMPEILVKLEHLCQNESCKNININDSEIGVGYCSSKCVIDHSLHIFNYWLFKKNYHENKSDNLIESNKDCDDRGSDNNKVICKNPAIKEFEVIEILSDDDDDISIIPDPNDIFDKRETLFEMMNNSYAKECSPEINAKKPTKNKRKSSAISSNLFSKRFRKMSPDVQSNVSSSKHQDADVTFITTDIVKPCPKRFKKTSPLKHTDKVMEAVRNMPLNTTPEEIQIPTGEVNTVPDEFKSLLKEFKSSLNEVKTRLEEVKSLSEEVKSRPEEIKILSEEIKTMAAEFEKAVSAEIEKTGPAEMEKTLQAEIAKNVPVEMEKIEIAEVKSLCIKIKNRSPEVKKALPVEDKKTLPVEDKKTLSVEVKKTLPVEVKKTLPVEVKKTLPVEVKKTLPVEVKKILPVEVKKTLPTEDKKTLSDEHNRFTGVKTLPAEDKRQFMELEPKLPTKVNIVTFPEINTHNTNEMPLKYPVVSHSPVEITLVANTADEEELTFLGLERHPGRKKRLLTDLDRNNVPNKRARSSAASENIYIVIDD